MSALEAYNTGLDYSYAPGIFPCMECVLKRPELVRRVLVHSDSLAHEGIIKLQALCEKQHIRVETADKALRRISGKENCFAAAVFEKCESALDAQLPHVVLDRPSDFGNLGTILRTCLGFGIGDIALIRPCADVFDPKVVRASMGALFSLSIGCYASFEAYREAYRAHHVYPFMLDGSEALDRVTIKRPYTLVFGNEGSGLDVSFQSAGQTVRIPHGTGIDSLNLSVAAAIGIYHFTREA